jgi:solute:Na+ symporter, SSS family
VLLMVGIGLYFSRRQTSTNEYFVAGRSISGWVMGLSLFATVVSSISFIAYPGAGYAGKWWASAAPVLASPLLLIPIIFVFIPMYRDLISISVYEYIERRFDRVTRIYSTLVFFLANFAKLAFVFYVVGLTVHRMMGWNISAVLVAVGAITIFYTIIGGIKAVIWTDVTQGIILWVGGFVTLGYIFFLSPHSPAEMFSFASSNNMFDFGSVDLTVSKPTLWLMMALGFYDGLQKYGSDQTVVQRLLVARTGREAAKGATIGVLVTLLCALFFTLIGTSLWVFYHMEGNSLPAAVAAGKNEDIFPFFLQTRVPTVLTAVVLAALMSAAMSAASSALNGFGAVGVEDYYRLIKPNATDRQRLNVGRAVVATAGALCIAFSLILVRSQSTVMELWWIVAPIVSAGIVGMFFLALASTRANRQGIYAGIVCATGFTIWAIATMPDFQRLLSDLIENLGFQAWPSLAASAQVDPVYNRTFDLGFLPTRIHGNMIGIISGVLFVFVGYGASLLFPDNSAETKSLTFWGWRAKQKAETK